MEIQIEPCQPHQLDAIVRLSLRAWNPVFDSIEKVMDIEVYQHFYPDWQVDQKKAVEDVCNSEDTNVWVAIEAGTVAGFVAVKLDLESSMGEIYMLAVEPDFQGCGIGSALSEFALDRMKDSGMSVAMVETGGGSRA